MLSSCITKKVGLEMRKIKIGILTYCHPVNYGAYLQSYALCYRLNQEEDFTAELIDYKMKAEAKHYLEFLQPQKNVFRMLHCWIRYVSFQNAWKDQTSSTFKIRCDSTEIVREKLYKKYDIIITGSDEIWQVDGMRGFPTPYFLPGDYGAIKVAYAVSGRTPFSILSKDNYELLNTCLNQYAYIGTRDESTYKQVAGLVADQKKVKRNPDPTFIYSFPIDVERGKKILREKFKVDLSRPCIGIMFMEYRGENPNLLRYVEQVKNSEMQVIALYDWEMGIADCPSLHPLDWVNVVAALDGMISMYFHGVCFSIICGTPILAIEKRAPSRNESKLYNLLYDLQLSEEFSFGVEEAIRENKVIELINKANDRIRENHQEIINNARMEFVDFIESLRNIIDG